MQWMTGVVRIWVMLILAIGATACAARSATPGVAHPSPFPAPPSPTEVAPGTVPTFASVSPSQLMQTALSFRGTRYAWGGESPATGFDCSGFIKYVLAQHRLPAPRTTAEQYRLGARVAPGQLRVGDLVFFSTIAPGPSHVGLAISQTEFIHAPASNGVVRVEPMTSTYWRSRFVGARRILRSSPTSPRP